LVFSAKKNWQRNALMELAGEQKNAR